MPDYFFSTFQYYLYKYITQKISYMSQIAEIKNGYAMVQEFYDEFMEGFRATEFYSLHNNVFKDYCERKEMHGILCYHAIEMMIAVLRRYGECGNEATLDQNMFKLMDTGYLEMLEEYRPVIDIDFMWEYMRRKEGMAGRLLECIECWLQSASTPYHEEYRMKVGKKRAKPHSPTQVLVKKLQVDM